MGWKVIKIADNEMEDMCRFAEEMLRNGGRLMDCIDRMHHSGDTPHYRDGGHESNEMWQRDGWQEGDSMSHRIESIIHQRRGVKGTGPYSRY